MKIITSLLNLSPSSLSVTPPKKYTVTLLLFSIDSIPKDADAFGISPNVSKSDHVPSTMLIFKPKSEKERKRKRKEKKKKRKRKEKKRKGKGKKRKEKERKKKKEEKRRKKKLTYIANP
jgi:hypothetical protein